MSHHGVVTGTGAVCALGRSSAEFYRRLLAGETAIRPMTAEERRRPDVLKASRKKRVAAGSGTKVEEVNKLLKTHRGMADMMKAMGGAKRGPLAGLANALGMGAGMPSPEEMAKLAEKMPGGLPGGLPKLPPGMPAAPPFPGAPSGLPGGLPGLGGPRGPGLPGLGGFPGFGKKK